MTKTGSDVSLGYVWPTGHQKIYQKQKKEEIRVKECISSIEVYGMSPREWRIFLSLLPRFWKILRKHPHLRVNTHNHTTVSDGELGLVGLLFGNWICGFRTVAITDHNVVWNDACGRNRMIAYLFRMIFGINVVSGVEVSCCEELPGLGRREVHIVLILSASESEHKRVEYEELCQRMLILQKDREVWMDQVIGDIRSKGYQLPSFLELKKDNGNVTLKTVALSIRDAEGRSVVVENFEKTFMHDGGDIHRPKDFLPSVKEMLLLAKAAGWISIFPHPVVTLGREDFSAKFSGAISLFKRWGLGRAECYTKKQTRDVAIEISELCSAEGIGISAGADTHTLWDLCVYMRNMLDIYE